MKIKYRNKRDRLGRIKLQLSSLTRDRIAASLQTATLSVVFAFILSNCYTCDSNVSFCLFYLLWRRSVSFEKKNAFWFESIFGKHCCNCKGGCSWTGPMPGLSADTAHWLHPFWSPLITSDWHLPTAPWILLKSLSGSPRGAIGIQVWCDSNFQARTCCKTNYIFHSYWSKNLDVRLKSYITLIHIFCSKKGYFRQTWFSPLV